MLNKILSTHDKQKIANKLKVKIIDEIIHVLSDAQISRSKLIKAFNL